MRQSGFGDPRCREVSHILNDAQALKSEGRATVPRAWFAQYLEKRRYGDGQPLKES